MYGTDAGYVDFIGSPAPTPYIKYEVVAVSQLKYNMCPNFPTEEEFGLLDEAIQIKIQQAIYFQIEHYSKHEDDFNAIYSDVTIGKYREKFDPSIIQKSLVNNNARYLLNDSGVCSIWINEECGCKCFDT